MLSFALQVIAILSVPYFVYLSFDILALPLSTVRFRLIFLIQFVFSRLCSLLQTRTLPGASAAQSFAFTMYFGPFFVVGLANKIKPAICCEILLYYGIILISAPFSYL